MDQFRLKLKWCKNLSRRLFNVRQCRQEPTIVSDTEEAKNNAAVNPDVFPAAVL